MVRFILALAVLLTSLFAVVASADADLLYQAHGTGRSLAEVQNSIRTWSGRMPAEPGNGTIALNGSSVSWTERSFEYGPVSIANIDVNRMVIDSSNSQEPDGTPDISIFIAFKSPATVPIAGHLATQPTATRPGIVFLLSSGQFDLAKRILEDIHDLASGPQQAKAENCVFGNVPDNQGARFVHDNTDTWSRAPVGRQSENEVNVSWTMTRLPGTDDRQKIRFHIANARPERRVIGISWTVVSNKGERYSQNTSVGGLNGKGAVDSQAYTPFGDFRCIASVEVHAVSCSASNPEGAPGSYLPGCPSPPQPAAQQVNAPPAGTASEPPSLDPNANANVRASQQYERLLCTNPAFRAKRIAEECGPLDDPQLHQSCVVSLQCGAAPQRRSNRAPPSETIR